MAAHLEDIRLFNAKLASSGISDEQGKMLGLTVCGANATKVHWKPNGLPAVHFPYLDPLTGEPVLRNGTAFYRVRALRDPKPLPKNFAKYMQPANTGCVVYFPKGKKISWPKLLADPRKPLIVTEGELKAAKACIEGFPTIALGGVWNFSNKDKKALLPELRQIAWDKRKVIIAFDSDAATNHKVYEAMRRLANLLIERGAKVFRMVLPDVVEDGKTGLDDLLITDCGAAKLHDLIESAEPMSFVPDHMVPENAGLFAGMTLAEVITDLCFVTRGDAWWSLSRAVPLTEKGLNNALSGISRPQIEHQEYQPQAFTGWLRAMHNVTTYSRFVRRGGQPPICESSLGADDKVVNQWRPLPPVPEAILERVRREGPAAARPWLTIASDVCNGEREQIEQLLDWAAFVAMEPGYKPGWSVVLYSSEQGIGKDMFGYGLSRTLGPGNSTAIARKDVEQNYNSYMEKRLVNISDLQTTTRGSMNGSDVYNTLKQLTSNFPKTVTINEKYQPIYDADNLAAWIISTNDEAPMTIPAEDRRWYVVKGTETKREAAFYAATFAWLEARETGDLIRAFLQLRWEAISKERRAVISGSAPETDVKMMMVDAGMTPVMSAIKEWITDDGCPDLVTLKDILQHLHDLKLNDWLARNAPIPNQVVLGIWMKSKFRAPLVPISKDGKSMPARLPDKKNTRVYAVKRADMYKALSVSQVGELYASQTAKVRSGVKY